MYEETFFLLYLKLQNHLKVFKSCMVRRRKERLPFVFVIRKNEENERREEGSYSFPFYDFEWRVGWDANEWLVSFFLNFT